MCLCVCVDLCHRWVVSFFLGWIFRGRIPFLGVNLHAGLSRVGDLVYRAHCSVVFVPFYRENDLGLMICPRCSRAWFKREWTQGQWQCCLKTADSQYVHHAFGHPRGQWRSVWKVCMTIEEGGFGFEVKRGSEWARAWTYGRCVNERLGF